MSAALYDRAILRLAARAGEWPMRGDAQVVVTRRSPTCGSRLELGIDVVNERIARLGMTLHLCAVGQAAATLFADHALAADAAEIAAAPALIAAWLAGEPDTDGLWPGLTTLAAVRGYPARHAAVRLPFEAGAAALAALRVPA